MLGTLLFSIGVLFIIIFSSQDQSEVEIISASPEPEKIVVHVSGAVIKPGLYQLDADARINDALVLAEGLSAEADREWFQQHINLAQKIDDGAKLYIPFQGEETSQDNGLGSLKDGKVNLNTCTRVELETLPGIGPATAEKIISYRQENGSFSQVEDLKKVSGIGEKTFADLEDQLSVY